MKIILFACLTLAAPVAALAAPAQPKVVAKPAVEIDPQARAIFARAAKLYGRLQGLHLEWKTTAFDEDRGGAIAPFAASLDYDAAGRMRLENPANTEILVVNDRTVRSAVTNFNRDENGKIIVFYTTGKIGEYFFARPSIEQDLSFSQGLTFAFELWLGGEDGLNQQQLEEDLIGLPQNQFRVGVLSAQPFGGQACDLVRINSRDGSHFVRDRIIYISQTTYWFARSDGRLMRVQEKSIEGAKTTQTSDVQFEVQQFNPKFAPDIFKFTPPKGAVLRK